MNSDIQSKVKEFFQQYPSHDWPAGQILIQAFDEPAGVYFIEKGSIRQYDINYRGDEMVLTAYRANAFIPMSWALGDIKNQYYFETIEPSVLRLAPKEEVVAFLHEYPEITLELLIRLYSGVNGLLGKMAHLMGSSAYVRILHELSVQVKRAKSEKTEHIYLPMKEYELGTYCGLSSETVSREFKKLKERGIAKASGSGIEVINFKKLINELQKNN